MDDFISKPFDAEGLVATILHHVQPTRLLSSTVVEASHAAPVVMAWPQITGVDTADAQTRLVGDCALFLTMLEQLLNEFADIAIPALHDDSAELAGHAAFLHRLGGSAGMLGARAVHQLAGAAEAACVAGDAGQAAALATRLCAELQTLRQSAAPEFSAVRARAEEAAPDDREEIEPERVAELIDLLRRKSLLALDGFSTISGPLRRRMGKEAHAQLRDCIERLDFDVAVTALLESEHRHPGSSGATVAGPSTRMAAAAGSSLALPASASGWRSPGPAGTTSTGCGPGPGAGALR
jgi:HPt (histidine-containing phosphotransfer) domain-containing protein